MSKIFIALSGGVDSAVAALLLKKQGYEIYGVHMQNWDSEINEGVSKESNGCFGKKDLIAVKNICKYLDIPLYVYSFVPEYWEYVFEEYIENLEKNLNTNPDVRCNAYIKFGVLLDTLMTEFGDIKLATGHWARVIKKNNRYYLGTCSNALKDQTYFLSSLNEKQLSKSIFPLENISSKENLRSIAREYELSIWDKRDSVGICFIGKRKYREFISKFIPQKEGDLVDIETGNILGKHKGIHLYVLHQSSGLFLKGYKEKYYICKKNTETNTIYLCRKSCIKKYLYREKTICNKLHWINEKPELQSDLFIKPRHSVQYIKIRITHLDADKCVFVHESMYITAPGQTIAFYDVSKTICLGNGVYIDGE